MRTRLTVSGFELNLSENIAIPLNFSIADFTNPQGRKRSFSKQISIVGTQNNLNVFYTTFALSVVNIGNGSTTQFQFDPTVQQPCEVFFDEQLVMKGLFYLKEVEYINGNYVFKAEILSEFVDLFGQLKSLNLAELQEMQKYEHTLTRANIIDSFDTQVIVNGVPTSNFTGGNPDGFGYLYPLVDYGYFRVTDTHFQIDQLIPHFYVRELFYECFKIAGLDISSTFFDSNFAKKLVIGSGDGTVLQLDNTELSARSVQFTADANQTWQTTPFGGTTILLNETRNYFSGVGGDNNIAVITLTDARNQYSESNGVLTVQKTGSYKIEMLGALDVSYFTDGTFGALGIVRLIPRLRRNGAFINSQNYEIIITDFTVTDVINLNFVNELQCIQGDELVIEWQVIFQTSVTGATYAGVLINVQPTTTLDMNLTSQDVALIEGATVPIARALPNMKCSDYIASVIKMFNLYVSDPVDGVVTVEPYSEFYKDTDESEDWTNKVDYNKPIKILPASTIDGKFYNFQFTDDKDYYRMLYSDTWGAGYGDRSYEVPSTFQVGEKVTQLSISQSVISDRNTGLLMPAIFSFNPQNLEIKPFKGKPRVYFYNGLKTGNWRLKDVLSGLFDDLTDYPSIHHFDDWENPTFDLNFQLPEELYYTTTDITFINLWSEYYRDFIQELTGRDSKIIDLFLRLNAEDIRALDFGKLKNIDGVLWRLNEIKDFDNTATESTKCTLMKYLG